MGRERREERGKERDGGREERGRRERWRVKAHGVLVVELMCSV